MRRDQYNIFLERDVRNLHHPRTDDVIRLMRKYPDHLDLVWSKIMENSVYPDINVSEIMQNIPNFDVNMVGNFGGYGETILENTIYFDRIIMDQLLKLGANPNSPGMLRLLMSMVGNREYDQFFELLTVLQKFGFAPTLTYDVWFDALDDPDDPRLDYLETLPVDWLDFADKIKYQPYMKESLEVIIDKHPPHRGFLFVLSKKIPSMFSSESTMSLANNAYITALRHKRKDPDVSRDLEAVGYPGL